MRGHGSERVLAVVLRRGVRVAGVRGVVHAGEPFHGGAQHAVFGQHLGDVFGHGAQILADDHTVRAGGLDRQDGEHDLVVVGHIGTVARGAAARDPPQAEQAEHMVDAQGAGVREHVVHHLTVDAVAGRLQILRTERRLAPVLSELVVEVRRGADRHAVGESFGTPPHVGAEGVHAHRHVLHQTERHAGVLGGLLRGGHLLVGNPLQPALELEHVMVVTHQSRHSRRVLVGAEEPRVLLPRRTPHLKRQAPGGEGVQVRPRRALELGEGRLALPGARRGENQPQRLTFGVPRGVDVHRLGAVIGGGHRGVQLSTCARVASSSAAYSGMSCGRI